MNSARFFLCTALVILFVMHSENNSYSQSRDILTEHMDTTVSPSQNFYKYANGGWIKQNPIPPSESEYGIYNLVMKETYDRMKNISDDAAGDMTSVKGSNTQKIGDFYFTGMDTIAIEIQGISKLNPELDRINSITDNKSIFEEIARLQMIGSNPVAGIYIYQDAKNSEKTALHIWQGGIGLPDRNYYFNKDERTKNIRREYSGHISRMFILLGDNEENAEKNAKSIIKIETKLAGASRKLEDLRDPYTNYNKMTLSELNKLSPSIKWKEIFRDMNINGIDSVIVGQPEFFTEVEKIFKELSNEDWKAYFKWNLIHTFATYLSKQFDDENFNFYGKILYGTEEHRPRWKRVLDNEGNYLGDALGQLYVQKYYSPEIKKRYEDLTDKIIASYKNRIENLDWMSNATKQKALEKLSKVRKKVGYPDKWKDYSSMNISRSSYVENIIQGNLWYYNYYLNKLGKPVDRTEWDITPQTYNAYYSSSNNEIVLPAAIFIIPDFPDSLIDDAIIYGYAGAGTIGHEITHGFDDEGRLYDESGNLRNWWSKEDEEMFKKRAQKYIDQFSSYVVLDSMHINGEATLGENIADLGGLVIGLDAFKQTEEYKKGEKISGLTPVQRYFLGYALGWLDNQRDESLASQIMSDVHSPAFLRVNGPMSDIPDFYEAFNIKEGDPMWRPDSLRVKIW